MGLLSQKVNLKVTTLPNILNIPNRKLLFKNIPLSLNIFFKNRLNLFVFESIFCKNQLKLMFLKKCRFPISKGLKHMNTVLCAVSPPCGRPS